MRRRSWAFERLEQRHLLAAAWQSDNGNGTFTNPVLYADYPDPDIVRVGSDFYMASTTFVGSPGINLLHSKDLVNWEFTAHVASTVDGGNLYNLIGGTAYQKGYWAPSLRYYNGTFYVADQPTFANGRIYYATDPAGPWQFYQLDRSIYDPGLFIDDNGTGYIVCGSGSLTLMTLNANFSQIVSQKNNFLTLPSGGEGSHVIKRGSYYYVFNANPSVSPYQLLVSRATDLANGPWTTQVALTETTGGHQGAIVDLPDSTPETLLDNQWFGFVMQDSGAIGRMPRIGPVFWENNWPIFGTTTDRNDMPATSAKPILGQPITQLATSDDFSAAALGLQWEWNHNPDNTRWSLSERPGYLRLRPTQASEFWTARNSLTQKGQGPRSHGVVKLDLSNMQPGDIAGFGTLGKVSANIYVSVDAAGNKTLNMNMRKDQVGSYTGASGVPIVGNTIYLRTDLDFVNNLGVCSFSTDGASWIKLGGNFELMWGYGSTFQGEQFAIFSYNPNTASSAGYVDVDSFTFDGTADLVAIQRGRPTLNAARTTFVGDNGQLLRGPYTSTEWTNATSQSNIAKIKALGFNAVHLYAEVFDANYPNAGSTAPGYAAARVDSIVQSTRNLGLYLVITIGNGANNGNYNRTWIEDFWKFYAPRYASETHVLFEIQNEPVAWGPPYSSPTATPPGAVNMEVSAYNIIRTYAPNTPVLLFSYAVFANTGGGNAAVQDIQAFNQAVFGNANAVWTNEAVAFHGYGGATNTPTAVQTLLNAGYPVFMTEFAATDWGGHASGLDVELTAALERLKVSWLTFEYIPPSGVSQDVTIAANYQDLVNRSGLGWTPDFGTWPAARGVFGNGGLPRATTSTFVNNQLTGTLRIQAEDFDTGGQGVAYNDATSANDGGQYRTNDAVDISTTSDAGGGYAVSSTAAGEWIEYTIMVNEPGFYDLNLRYAAPSSGSVDVSANNQDVTGQFTLASTGSSTTWSTATHQVFLDYGQQKLHIAILTGGFNLNWIELTPQVNGPLGNGTYKLVNRNSGMVMQFDTANNVVLQQPGSGSTVQQWTLLNLGAGQYKVTSAYNSNSWIVSSGSGNSLNMAGGWNIGSKNQRFVVRPSGDGFYRIAPVDQGIDLEVKNSSLASGGSIVQNPYVGTPNQQWAILTPGATLFPTGLVAYRNASGFAQLNWNAVTGASSYNVKRSTSSGGSYTTIATGLTAAGYTDSTAAQGTAYYYVVSAVSGGGESLNSMEASLLPPYVQLNFNEGAGTTAADSSGHGWNGTLQNGATWTTGVGGKAVALDGANDYVSLPSGVAQDLTQATISGWVYLNSVATWSRIFDFGTGTSNYMFLTPKASSGNVRFAITSGSGEQQISGTAPLPSGVWTHVAVTLGNGIGILYVNGVEVGRNTSMTLTPSSLGNTTQNWLGRSQWSNDPYLNGFLDDFRIYNTALSPGDVKSLMIVPSSAPPTVAIPALASPSTVTGSTTSVSVLGADDGGEANLTYTWGATGPGTVAFSASGTNAAKSATATFTKAGAYMLTATITDLNGQSIASSTSVTVNQTMSSIGISPTGATVAPGGQKQFTATAYDQFGAAFPSQPSFVWSSSNANVGSVNATGLFSASGLQGITTVTATAGALGGSATVNVTTLPAPALWYRFDDGSGTTAADASGNGRLGTLAGSPAWTTGQSGGGLALNGTSQSVSVPALNLNSNTVTMSGWIKRNGVPSDYTGIVFYRNGSGTASGISLRNTGALAYHWNDNSGTWSWSSGLTVPNGVWTFVALVITPSNATMYMQPAGGVMQSAVNAVANVAQAFSGVSYVGQDPLGGRFFNGSVDDVRVYGASLTGSQVTQLYNSYYPPTVATPAAASPATVSGTTATLSVLGASNLGESALKYTWTTIGTGPAPVMFSANGTNAAKSTVATFTSAGTYTLGVTIVDTYGQNVTSSVNVTVNQTLTAIIVSPAAVSLSENGIQQFAATAKDQFGVALSSQPAFTWSATGGMVDAAGLYTAPFASGSFQVTAASAAVSGSAMASVTLLAGDTDGDGKRTVSDVGTLMAALADVSAYQTSYSLSPNDLASVGNLDGDGAVTNLDLQAMIVWLANAGGGAPAPFSAPASFTAPASATVISDSQVESIASIGLSPLATEVADQSSPSDLGQGLPVSASSTKALVPNRAVPSIAKGLANTVQLAPKDGMKATPIFRAKPFGSRYRLHDVLARDELFTDWPSALCPTAMPRGGSA